MTLTRAQLCHLAPQSLPLFICLKQGLVASDYLCTLPVMILSCLQFPSAEVTASVSLYCR